MTLEDSKVTAVACAGWKALNAFAGEVGTDFSLSSGVGNRMKAKKGASSFLLGFEKDFRFFVSCVRRKARLDHAPDLGPEKLAAPSSSPHGRWIGRARPASAFRTLFCREAGPVRSL